MQVQEKTVQSLEQLKKENAELKRQLEERQGFFDIRCGRCGNMVQFFMPEKNNDVMFGDWQADKDLFPLKSVPNRESGPINNSFNLSMMMNVNEFMKIFIRIPREYIVDQHK